MLHKNLFLLLAEYNQWMNSKIYGVCSELSDEELRLDRGAFFGSMYLTLNHIAYGDLAFMSRFTGDPPQVPELGAELFPNFLELKSARFSLDIRLTDWVSGLENSWLDQVQTYKSKVDGKVRSVSRRFLIMHMFNHQTHHRGQVTTLLSQLNLDIGSTDIPFMPQFTME